MIKDKIKKVLASANTRAIMNRVIVGVVSYSVTTLVIWGISFSAAKVGERLGLIETEEVSAE